VNDDQTRYVAGMRRAASWLSAHDMPVLPIVSPARTSEAKVSLFWNLIWRPDDLAVAEELVAMLERTGAVVGWRKFNTDPKRVTLCAVEQTIPATIFISLRAADEAVGGVARDFTTLGVDFL
jgi:hypothetical protein